MKFENKVVIITGASSGIGEGVAKHFLAEGAKVVGCGIEPSMKIEDKNAIYVQADLTKFEQAENVVAEAVKAFGKVNKLVCCAGVTFVGSLESTTSESFNRELQINLGGVFNMAKAAIVELKKQENSTIVTVGSDLGVHPIPERIGYCPSKAGVIMLTKCIALEYAPHIRVNCILPGLVRTPMIEQRFQEAEDPAALEEAYASIYPLHKMGKIEDMANAISFLSSDESGFITGEIMHVCGGSLI
ncbi:SDR family oxidoreductase [Paludicola sp. MB14-C6]|uniref:SDR family NAD(P)-dependent oxidoreductase n=1 Tax=Paludihabitans sp. MB14-C6 TaxID=3070656 RepID=UPI0027DC4DA5|nr:SDR family oxidoreductase [Paludicola sp. MB14-C6]WMJ23543.1 SDR family oxidoreductase [Paludicola sp. MB14-C6]